MTHSLNHYSSNNDHVVKGCEVFVGGLPRTVTEDKLSEIFSTCGEILDIRLIKDPKGCLKGFGFVRFSTKAAADKAVREKSGLLLEGKEIGVQPSVKQDTLFMGNLLKGWTTDEFNILVRQVFPDVVSVDLVTPFSTGETPPGQKKQNRGFAFIKFSSHAAAARAHRAGSSPEFLLDGKVHPAVEWAEEDPELEVDPEELAKVKVAFIRYLPAGTDKNFLKKLFRPFGKVDKVIISNKTRSPVGFVHFAERSNLDGCIQLVPSVHHNHDDNQMKLCFLYLSEGGELDDAIREMNGKTVKGPNGGPPFKLQVEVRRPVEKSRKRALDDPQPKQPSKVLTHSKFAMNDPGFNAYSAPKATTQQEALTVDHYEDAVVQLPLAVKERLLRILRLGIATRFDIDIECLISLKELSESTAISVLDQFMLSGAHKINKGAYLTGLISKHQLDKLGYYDVPGFSRARDLSTKDSELSSFSSRVQLPAFDSISSHADLTTARSDGFTSRYSYMYSDYPLSSRAPYGRLQEANPSSLHLTPAVSTHYGQVGMDNHFKTPSDRATRHQMRFDPFTGEPYKFDPFSGEPIRPESPHCNFRSPY